MKGCEVSDTMPPVGWSALVNQPDWEWLSAMAAPEHRAFGGQIVTLIEGGLAIDVHFDRASSEAEAL